MESNKHSGDPSASSPIIGILPILSTTGTSVNTTANESITAPVSVSESSNTPTPVPESISTAAEPTNSTTTVPTTKKYTVKFKRNRSSRACAVCHSRKVRCDAMIHIPCTNCLTFGCECKFPEQKIRKNARILKDLKKQATTTNDTSTAIDNTKKDKTIIVKGEDQKLSGEISSKKTDNALGFTNDTTTESILSNTVTPSSIPTQQQPSMIPPSAIKNITSSAPTSFSKRKKEPIPAISARTFQIDPAQLQTRSLNTVRFFGSTSPIMMLFDGRNKAATGGDNNIPGSTTIPTSTTPTNPNITKLLSTTSTQSYITTSSPLPSAITEVLRLSKDTLNTNQLETLRVRGAFFIPEKQLCDDLIKTYFEEIYPIEPIIDKAEFMRDYESGKVSLLLLQSVFLAASCVSSNPALFHDEDINEDGHRVGSSYKASSTFFKRAKVLYDAGYETDPIAVVQSLILFLGFWDGFDDVMSNTYYWTRNAISIAQGYGFHRDIPASGSGLSPSDLRISKILFWYLYQRDIASSIGYGRPKMIQLDDCDVKMLTLDDFPSDIPKVNVEAFIQMVRVSEVASIVAQEQYSVRAERLNRKGDMLAINHCDMLMSSWRSSLPSELQYSPQRESPFAVSVLNLYYYSIVCLCHRSSMAKPVMINGKHYPSEGIVFKASRIIADIAAKLMKRDELKFCAVYVIPIFFNAAVTFLIHREFGNPLTSKSSKVGYNLTAEALRSLGSRYRLASTMKGALDVIENDPSARAQLLKMVRKTPDSAAASAAASAANTNTVNTPNVRSPAETSSFQQTTLSPSGTTPLTNPNSQYASSVNNPTVHGQLSSHFPIQQQASMATPQPPVANPPHDIEFPDLYLFTHNLTSSNDTTFDPSELFPSSNFNFTNNAADPSFGTNVNKATPAHHGLAYILQQPNSTNLPTTAQQQQYQFNQMHFGGPLNHQLHHQLAQHDPSSSPSSSQQHNPYQGQPGIPETPTFPTHNSMSYPQQQLNSNNLWQQQRTPGAQSTTSTGSGMSGLSMGDMMVMDPSVKLDDLSVNFNF